MFVVCALARSLTPAIPMFIIMYDIHGRERHYLNCLFTFHSKSIHKSETMLECRLYGATRVFHSHRRRFCAPHGFFVNFAYVFFSSSSGALFCSKDAFQYMCECHGFAFECLYVSFPILQMRRNFHQSLGFWFKSSPQCI